MNDPKSTAETMVHFAQHSCGRNVTPERLAAAHDAIDLGGQIGTMPNDRLAALLRDAIALHERAAPAIAAYMQLLVDALDGPRAVVRMHGEKPVTFKKPHWAEGRKFDAD